MSKLVSVVTFHSRFSLLPSQVHRTQNIQIWILNNQSSLSPQGYKSCTPPHTAAIAVIARRYRRHATRHRRMPPPHTEAVEAIKKWIMCQPITSAACTFVHRKMSSDCGWLYFRVPLKMIFVLHSAMLLYHLHFLVRCEPWAREPQQKLPCKTLAKSRDDGVSDWIFHHI